MAIKIRTSRDIDARFMHQLGKIAVDYDTIVSVFGEPNFNADAGDSFDGNETRAWHIEFVDERKRVLPARIIDAREFGDTSNGANNVRVWVVQGRDKQAFDIVRQALNEYVQYNKKRTGNQVDRGSSTDAVIIK